MLIARSTVWARSWRVTAPENVELDIFYSPFLMRIWSSNFSEFFYDCAATTNHKVHCGCHGRLQRRSPNRDGQSECWPALGINPGAAVDKHSCVRRSIVSRENISQANAYALWFRRASSPKCEPLRERSFSIRFDSDLIDVRNFALIDDERLLFKLARIFLKKRKFVVVGSGHCFEVGIDTGTFDVAPIVQKPVWLKLNQLTPCWIQKPKSIMQRAIDQVQLIHGVDGRMSSEYFKRRR